MAILPKQSIDLMQFLSNYPWHFSQNYNNSPTIYIPFKTQNCPGNLEEKNKAGDITLPDLILQSSVIKAAWYWLKNRRVDKCNRTESPEVNSHIFSQLIFSREGKNIQWRKGGLFSQWGWENTWTATGKSIKLELPHTMHKNKLKWLKDSNMTWHNKTPRKEHR